MESVSRTGRPQTVTSGVRLEPLAPATRLAIRFCYESLPSERFVDGKSRSATIGVT